jgi:hypothetical protein
VTTFAEEQCITCGVQFGVVPIFQKTCKDLGPKKSFFCPNGHSMVYRESEPDKLRRERDRLKQEAARLQESIDYERRRAEQAERRISAAKGQMTKLKKRSAEGRCPCCNRVFVDLLSHMKSKHVEYENEPIDFDKSEQEAAA